MTNTNRAAGRNPALRSAGASRRRRRSANPAGG